MPRPNIIAFHFRVVSGAAHDKPLQLEAGFDPEWEVHLKQCEPCRRSLIQLLRGALAKVEAVVESPIIRA